MSEYIKISDVIKICKHLYSSFVTTAFFDTHVPAFENLLRTVAVELPEQPEVEELKKECGELQKELARYKWISVKDRLPEGCETVLICNANKKFVASGYYSPVEKRWNQIGNRFLLFTITHWMPLPEPPKSEDDAE